MRKEIRLLLSGIALWLIGTLAIRAFGEQILRPDNPPAIAVLFVLSFPAMAIPARMLCAGCRMPRDQWLSGAACLAFPTLLLDPFSTLAFGAVFPSLPASAAPLFAAWMLWCCAGAIAGVLVSDGRRP